LHRLSTKRDLKYRSLKNGPVVKADRMNKEATTIIRNAPPPHLFNPDALYDRKMDAVA